MSKYDKASLVMIPSGYKAEKLYSVLPVNGNGDFTHDRNLGTATRVNKDGLIETVAADVPRLDYPLIDGVVQDCPALLLEPAATQLVRYSEDYSQTAWTKNLSTVTLNEVISPDGTQNASKLESSADGLNSRIEMFPTVSDNTTYTASVFVKKGDLNFVRLTLRTKAGVSVAAAYDINNGSIGSTFNNPDDTRIDYYGNGWYRVSITEDVVSGASSVRFQIILASADNSVDTDDDTFFYVWGAMVEASSYPTSYIPNDGTTATITRNADVCNSAGTAAEFNDSEGVLYAEIKGIPENTVSSRISVSDGSIDNRVIIEDDETANRIKVFHAGGGTTREMLSVTDSSIANQYFKIAVNYNGSNGSVYINGFEKDTSTDLQDITGLSSLRFESSTGNYDFYGKCKELAVFKEALTDSELEDLTSWDSFNEMATGQEYTIE